MTSSTLPLLGLAYGISEIGLSLFKRSHSADNAADAGSLRLIWTTIGCSMLLGWLSTIVVPQARLPFAVASLHVAGTTLVVLGVALRWTSIAWLGKFFTVNVTVAADQHVIDTGPYRFIRHPSYTGALLTFLGLALFSANWLAMLILMMPVTWAFIRRIRIEEAALCAVLGESYHAYSRRTKRLVPFVY